MTQEHFLDFETPVQDVSKRIQELQSAIESGDKNLPEKDPEGEIERLEVKKARLLRVLYRKLEPWQKVHVARHPARPQTRDYVAALMTDFEEIHGDRLGGGEDKAMVAGLARFNGQAVAVLGMEKGRDTKTRVARNFGMPKPEGYRKALRVMDMADRFSLPILTFVDTPGAYPGVDAESRGQSEAIARCIEKLLQVDVPVVTTITGEGGSGGALALATADRVVMLEHSIYSVISPEGCAGILWRVADKTTVPQAAEALQVTADQMLKRRIVDAVVKEPVGGAQRDAELAMKRVGQTLQEQLDDLANISERPVVRRERFLAVG